MCMEAIAGSLLGSPRVGLIENVFGISLVVE